MKFSNVFFFRFKIKLLSFPIGFVVLNRNPWKKLSQMYRHCVANMKYLRKVAAAFFFIDHHTQFYSLQFDISDLIYFFLLTITLYSTLHDKIAFLSLDLLSNHHPSAIYVQHECILFGVFLLFSSINEVFLVFVLRFVLNG